MITQSRLLELFDYCVESGRLIRRIKTPRGKLLTHGVSPQGYFVRWVDGKCYVEHRLVWLYHHGAHPIEIDHTNGVKTDNRIENLRECDRTQNNGNQKKKNRNGRTTSKYKGVYFRANWGPTGKWVAQIVHNKQHRWLGGFDTELEAAMVYQKASLVLFGEYAYLANRSLKC